MKTDSEHRLIIHELGRRCVDAVRGHAMGSRIKIRHSAGLADTLNMVRAAPGSTLVIELGKQPLNSLDIVERVRSFSQGTAIIVVARSDQGYLEMPARELGAIAFVREPLTGSELARTVRSILGLQLKWAEKTGSV